MLVFFTNYHCSVNSCVVNDLLAIGHTVIMPSIEMARDRIGFFAPNDEHASKQGVRLVNHDEFLSLPPMAIIIPCNQLYEDFMRLYEARGRKDTLVYLPALSTSLSVFPVDGADYVISHDLAFHRASKAKYKIWYFNKPRVLIEPKTDFRKAFDEHNIKLYINNFDKEGFEPEYADALEFRRLWQERTGLRVPFYGYGMPDGWLSMEDVQRNIVDSMFTLVFKRRETFGQMVNESMLLGTPCIFLAKYINSTFTEYLITKDTAVIGETVEELLDIINNMSFESYETLCFEAQKQSEMYTNDRNRQEKLKWLFGKIKL